MKETPITRLPCYDRGTARGEFIAFITLGLVAVSLMGAAGLKSMQFAESRQEIAQRLESPAQQNGIMIADEEKDARTPVTLAGKTSY